MHVPIREYIFMVIFKRTVPVVMGGVKDPWGGTALKDDLLHRSRCHYGNLQRVDWLERQKNNIKDYTESNSSKLNKLLLLSSVI